jgi:hypothetical protein
MPEPPNEWLVCPKCRAELTEFLGKDGSDFYAAANLR